MYIAIDKEYIENRIVELYEYLKQLNEAHSEDCTNIIETNEEIRVLEDILSQGIEIPILTSWNNIAMIRSIPDMYPNGVIIKPKT